MGQATNLPDTGRFSDAIEPDSRPIEPGRDAVSGAAPFNSYSMKRVLPW